jgi:hypothetical protein
MNIEPMTVLAAGKNINSFVDSFRQAKRNRNDEYDFALASLLAAICETKLYVSGLNKEDSKETEAIIARLWHKAAVAMRRFDSSLAEKCYLKGDYWTEPASWTNNDVKRNRITLSEMHEVCRQLILDKK